MKIGTAGQNPITKKSGHIIRFAQNLNSKINYL